MRLSESWRNFGAPGERAERPSRITGLKTLDALPKTLNRFTREFEHLRTLPGYRMSAQFAVNRKNVCHQAVSRATCKPALKSLAVAPLCEVSGFNTNSG